jgi:imidazolonepropionase-like amidohydrolase
MYSPVPAGSLPDRGDCGPAWSPDGRHLAFIMDAALWVLPVDAAGQPTGEARMLSPDPADAPSWAGDSRTLLYLSNGELRTITVDGGQPNPVPLDLRWREVIPGGTTRVHAGRLWDGVTDTVRTDMDIVVRGNRILIVEPHTGGQRPGETFVDASRETVLPGLWDSHNHPTEEREYGARYFSLYLAYGLTTSVSQGSIAYEGIHHRESLRSGAMTGPRHLTTGELIDGSRTSHPPTRAIGTAEGLGRTLARAGALRYDFIKTYVRTPLTTMQEAARFAHDELGVPAGTHLIAQGVWATQDMITHLAATERLEYSQSRSETGVTYADARALLTDGRFHVIVTPFGALPLIGADPELKADRRVTQLMPPWLRADVAAISPPDPADPEGLADADKELGTCRDVLRAGGQVMAGSDTPITPAGLMQHMTLRAMVRAGMTPFEALRTATVIPANVFGVGSDLGTIEPGKLADLTFVDGDLADFNRLVYTPRVMKNGTLITQDELVAAFA